MLESIKLGWAWLAAQHESLPYLLTTLACLLAIDAWKKIHEKSWLWVISRAPFAAELTKAQEIAHNVVVALPQAIGAGFMTWLATGGQLLPTILGSVAGAGAPLVHHVRKAIKSWRNPPPGGDQKPVGVVERIHFPGPDGGPPSAALSRWLPACVYAVVFALALGAGTACSPSAWEGQQRALNSVVLVSNSALLPALERAHTKALTSAAQAQPDQESAALAVAAASEKWAPVWQAYDAYVHAVMAWQSAIDTEGDALSTALAARVALCRLHGVALELKVDMPDLPAGTCP